MTQSMDKISHNRRSVRLKTYDYSQPGAYFVTICAYNRECLFSEIKDGILILNKYGEIAKDEWERTGRIRPNIVIDHFVIMPNHLHGIIIIDGVGAHCNVPLQVTEQTEKFGCSTKNSIPTIVKLFKSTTTKQINELRNIPGAVVWQRNYYEHVIRDDAELNRIRQYIMENPLKWDTDSENQNVNRDSLLSKLMPGEE